MVRKGKLAIFESSNISETGEAMPTKIGVHAFDINPYLHKFFEPIPIHSIFSLPWTIVHGPKGKLAKSEKEQRRGGVMIIVVFDIFLMQLDSKGSVSGSYS